MREYENLKKLIPAEIMAKIPEKREHHAVWNLGRTIKEKNASLYEAGVKEDASTEAREALQKEISSTFEAVMDWHAENGFVRDAKDPQELRKPDHETDRQTNQKILSLVEPAYLKKIPFFVRGHATGKTCDLIAREFPDLYDAFRKGPTEDQKEEMKKLIDVIFEERMAKHDM